ncbi:discoidin domain-containing protein [Tahibacter amnicola]|uniref:Discoidin domain-containing protein n=1 Tax=Tahibacter amnicola TaxID=2976241 RepID=A0ABY6BKZ1_9GAMM|nr:discoidin domain-containing protein [Tahibacter amnicola]UXI70291.1 discoidin domain-containing protein [Tahibacter amnicola]
MNSRTRTFPRRSILSLALAGCALSAGYASGLGASADTVPAVAAPSNTYVVVYRHGDAESGRSAAIQRSLARAGAALGKPVTRLRTLATGAELVQVEGAVSVDKVIAAFSADPAVASAEPDPITGCAGSAKEMGLRVVDSCATRRLSDTVDALAKAASTAARPQDRVIYLADAANRCMALQGAVDLAHRHGALVITDERSTCAGTLKVEAAAVAAVAQAAASTLERAPELQPDQLAGRLLAHAHRGTTDAIALLDTMAVSRDGAPRRVVPVASATASSNDGNVPANAIDGSFTTRWSALGDGQWLQLNLTARETVQAVNIAWHQGDRRQSRFDVEVSETGTAWQRVFSGTSSGTTLQHETVRFGPVPARFVRIVGHGNTLNMWNSVAEVTVDAGQVTDPGNDRFGVRMVYPTVAGGETWFMNMTNPNNDPRFDPDGSAPLVRNTDGSWRFQNDSDNDAARLDVKTTAGYDQDDVEDNHGVLATRGYMFSPRDWKNTEITGYVRLRDASDMSDAFTWYSRGGKHSNPKPFCEGSAYKGDLFFNGSVQTAKEQWHVNYDFRPSRPTPAVGPLKDKWVGFKVMTYNLAANRHVRMELWVDETNTNTWSKKYETTDTGGWGSQARTCRASVADQVITWGGPLAVYRWDNIRKVDFKNLSVREIQPPVQ